MQGRGADGTVGATKALGLVLSIAARLLRPSGVANDLGGGFLIADTGNGVIRRVSAKGVITTVAGAGPGYPADPPSAVAAGARSVHLANPQGVAALPDGGFLIADTGDGVVALVTPDGLLSVVAGTGAPGSSGDGGPAQAAALNVPTRVVRSRRSSPWPRVPCPCSSRSVPT